MTDSAQNNKSNDSSSQNRTKPMTPAERKKYIEELKKKKEAEAKEKKRRDREEKKKNSEGGDPTKFIVIILVGLLVLGSISTVIYFVKPQMFTGEQKLDETEKEIEQKVAKLTKDIDSIVKDLPLDDKIVEIPAEKQEPQVANSFTLNTPCWVISHSSMVSEKYAKRNVEILSDKGLKCGYYWIPDYNPSGNKFYKVYIGPYTSKKEAKNALSEAKRYSTQAYLLHLK